MVRCWVSDCHIQEALVVDAISLANIFNTLAAAIICNLLIDQVVMALPQSLLQGKNFEK